MRGLPFVDLIQDSEMLLVYKSFSFNSLLIAMLPLRCPQKTTQTQNGPDCLSTASHYLVIF